MDEIIMRRLRHLQRLEENHEKDFLERNGSGKSDDALQSKDLSNVVSADWNRKRKQKALSAGGKPLPNNWRREHWKTLQSMAADYAGVEARKKEEALSALEAYEAGFTQPPAA
ncbi:hypothetical protein [Roseibium sp. MMSF_3544]|uniref:hypothetical protein n=1 Tax=unclassified Roseibium TaxID=2629323 RepID=UPI00273ECC51|nr:hypothetical protein [Roseibium sp. MMSF_3544]